ncbi:MAG: MotA/TolQ/ExbB proton channel family protein [Pseudomonadota bacterium]|nr:MotA/TolQ/ExbB proton channel family protein [Pseudomonadota bacterium]
MNPSTLIGIAAALALLASVLFWSASDPMLYVNVPGLAIVLCGTLAATFISYPLQEVLRIFRLMIIVMRNEKMYTIDDIEELVRIARIWMEGNLAGVENALERVRNPFLKTGMQLVVDLTPPEEIMDFMHWRTTRLAAREHAEAQLFRVMASFAPAFGMIGTLVGLINMMQVLGDGDMTAIGQQLAVALMTTFYGILLANLVFKPVAVKLERRTEQRLVLMNMVTQGISMMFTNKSSPSLMRETLKTFVEEHEDELREKRKQRRPVSRRRPAGRPHK